MRAPSLGSVPPASPQPGSAHRKMCDWCNSASSTSEAEGLSQLRDILWLFSLFCLCYLEKLKLEAL